ncbi:uncharacterized protein PAC_02712 [Phialocephala subalpina]|uniref:Uncharacterized protein n=1 Tax=Phialocephala subalpina TaxID=576137 RepID=A0A1L7WJ74_9HELO|nr:uncharacterized protein PAC_02712 [Phialocephala subalpina]
MGTSQNGRGDGAGEGEDSGGGDDPVDDPYPDDSSETRDEDFGQWVHMVFKVGKGPKSQFAVDIRDLPTNHEAFGGLSAAFRQHWGQWRASTSIKNIRLTKYQLVSLDGKAASLYDQTDLASMMPPEPDKDFVYSWRASNPIRQDPLIPDCILNHIFSHPNTIIEENPGEELRLRLPKRKAPLRCVPDQGFPEGWGLEWEEGFNWQFFYHCESLVCFFTLVFVVLWIALWKKDDNVSTAFTGGAFFLAAGRGGYLFALAVPEMFEFWRY